MTAKIINLAERRIRKKKKDAFIKFVKFIDELKFKEFQDRQRKAIEYAFYISKDKLK